MDKKYIIKSIIKVSKDKATIKYESGKRTVESKRAIYLHNNEETVLFKGIRLGVKFNDEGIANKIKVIEIYDEKVKAEEADRAEKISLEIQNEYDTDQVAEKVEIKNPTTKHQENVKHMRFEEIKVYIENSIPVYLYGPAGSGKNHVLQQIAEELGLEFYFTNSVQQEYKITGFIDAGGKYHETEFYKAFTNGGLFFLDELDASIPEVVVLLNAALANGYFEFPNGKVFAHKDFKVVAAGNTVGTGADEQYTGRLQLDQSTLDRFAMIEFDYDRNIELSISKGNEELVQFIRDLRSQAKRKGVNTTFSYRCITMVTKLEGKLDLVKIIASSVVKGMDKDTLETFTTTNTNKYSKALWTLKQQMSRSYF